MKLSLGVAEIKFSESGKLVGLLEDLSLRLKKLETAAAKATKKKTYGHSQPNKNRAAKTQFVPNVQAKPFISKNQAVTGQDVSNNNKKTHHRRKITLLNRPTQPLHRFATTTKLSVRRCVCAVNPVRTIAH